MKAKRQDSGQKGKNQLRIIGGRWRGRKLTFPDLPGLRPTPDRVRETLFNWLAPGIQGSHCLDLFTGSGALALEALSRGAQSCTLIDNSKQVITQLSSHMRTLHCKSTTLIQADTLQWLESPTTNKPFDIVFLDPPFYRQMILPCCQRLQAKNLIHSQSLIYIETEAEYHFILPDNWLACRQKQAGNVSYYLCEFEH